MENPTAESLSCAMMELADMMACSPEQTKLIDRRSWGHLHVYAPSDGFEPWFKTTLGPAASMFEHAMPGFKKRMKWAYFAGFADCKDEFEKDLSTDEILRIWANCGHADNHGNALKFARQIIKAAKGQL